jgi:hypothetical protein
MTARAEALFLEKFESEVLSQVDGHPDTNRWSAAGRGKSKANPRGEDGSWWRGNGPKMVQGWQEWRKKSGWRVLDMGDGTPAIELEIDVLVGDIPIKMFIDRVMVVPEVKEPVIVDLKSGARSPESDLQLGFYRYGLLKQFGLDVRFGTYYMARLGRVTETLPLRRYKPELVEKWITKFDNAREAKIYLPHITFRCKSCPMSDYCAAYGGRKADLDPDFEGAI